MTETLKDLAVAAYSASLEAERERIEALKQQIIEEQARSLGALLLEALGLQVEPTGPTIEVDGMTFTILADEQGHTEQSLHVVGLCPECGQRTYATFSNLVELGAVLSNPPRCTACRNAVTSDVCLLSSALQPAHLREQPSSVAAA